MYVVVTETEDWATIVAHRDGDCNPSLLMTSFTSGNIKEQTEDFLKTVECVLQHEKIAYTIVRQRG